MPQSYLSILNATAFVKTGVYIYICIYIYDIWDIWQIHIVAVGAKNGYIIFALITYYSVKLFWHLCTGGDFAKA